MEKLYWIAGIAGLAITPQAMVIACQNRGYFAIGGEILLAPLFLMVVAFIDIAIHNGRFFWEEQVNIEDLEEWD